VSRKPARRRVLHVIGRMQPGGTEIRLLEIMRNLCPSEFHIDVCTLSSLEGSLDAQVRTYGGRVISVPLNASFPLGFTRLLRRERYSVVHSHLLHATGAILTLAAIAHVPVRIAHFHAMGDGHPSTWRRRLQRKVMRQLIDWYATDIISCGEGAMNAIWRADWQSDPRCRVVYDAVDPSRFEHIGDCDRTRAELGLSPGDRIFLHVGNEVVEKNHARLISIFAQIANSDPAARLVLIGAGTDNANGVSARAINELALGHKVTALGIRHDVPRILAAVDALLLPSIREGLPGVVLEACVSGVPVLATDLPGVREIASRLPLVRYVPLTADDIEWAHAVRALPERTSRQDERVAAAEAFRASVFHIDRAVEAHRLLWAGMKERSAYQCF
jgi:glycosyltransferase involved in cell wall biosynthesis